MDQVKAQGSGANTSVSVRAGPVSETDTSIVQAGLLMDENKVWGLFANYAANQTFKGKTKPSANPNFKPSLVTSPSNATLKDVVANNAYTKAIVENADGSVVKDENGADASVVAAAKIDGATQYFLNDGTQANLSSGQSIVLIYAEPSEAQLALSEDKSNETTEEGSESDGENSGENNEATEEGAENGSNTVDPDDLSVLESSDYSSGLGQFLANSPSSINVTFRSGDTSASAQFEGGLLIDEALAWDMFADYAQDMEAIGNSRPEANSAFKPSVTLDFFASLLWNDALNNGMYRGAYVEHADGSKTEIVAAGTMQDQKSYVDTNGEILSLADNENIVVEYANEALTDEGLFEKGVNALADLLARAVSQGNASISVLVEAGEVSAQGQVTGGLLVSEAAAQQTVPGYAEASTAENASYDFTPQLTLNEDADEVLAQSVAAAAYMGTYIRSDSGEKQVVAAANIDGQILYADASGEVKPLGTGETLVMRYAAPASENTVASAAPMSIQNRAALFSENANYQISRDEKIIRKQWKQEKATYSMGFQGGVINASTVPNLGTDKTYWPVQDDGQVVNFADNENFQAAYLVVADDSGNEQRRFQIDWLGKIDNQVHYRLANSSSQVDSPITITSVLAKNNYIVFAYDDLGTEVYDVAVSLGNSTASLGQLSNVSYPSSISSRATKDNGVITITAQRPAGARAVLILNSANAVVEGKTKQTNSNTAVEGKTTNALSRLVQWTIYNPTGDLNITLDTRADNNVSYGMEITSQYPSIFSGANPGIIGFTESHAGKGTTVDPSEDDNYTKGLSSTLQRFGPFTLSNKNIKSIERNGKNNWVYFKQVKATGVSSIGSTAGNVYLVPTGIRIHSRDVQNENQGAWSTVESIPFSGVINSAFPAGSQTYDLQMGDMAGAHVTIQRENSNISVNTGSGTAYLPYYNISVTNFATSFYIEVVYNASSTVSSRAFVTPTFDSSLIPGNVLVAPGKKEIKTSLQVTHQPKSMTLRAKKVFQSSLI